MSSEDYANDSTSAYREFSKAERIQQLNDIDKAIAGLLVTTADALKTLASAKDKTPQTVATRKQEFMGATNGFLEKLQKIDIGMKRQIYGLEEANIISVDKPKMGGARQGDNNSGAGSVGKLDIGWLNSRSGRVGRDHEAELWAKSLDFLKKIENLKDGGTETTEDGRDVEMT